MLYDVTYERHCRHICKHLTKSEEGILTVSISCTHFLVHPRVVVRLIGAGLMNYLSTCSTQGWEIGQRLQ